MLLETNSNLFSNNSTPLPLQFNCFYSPKTELHFIFSSYKTDKKQCYCSVNTMFSLCNSSIFTFYFLCFSHLKPITLRPVSYLIAIKRTSFHLHISWLFKTRRAIFKKEYQRKSVLFSSVLN